VPPQRPGEALPFRPAPRRRPPATPRRQADPGSPGARLGTRLEVGPAGPPC
jgi:hypothetical protein